MEFETARPFEDKRKLNTLQKVLMRKEELCTELSLTVKQNLEYNSKFICTKEITNTVTDEDLYNYMVQFLRNTPNYSIGEKYLSITDGTIIISIGQHQIVYYVTLDENKVFKLVKKGAPYYCFDMSHANYRNLFVCTLIDYFKSMRFIITEKKEVVVPDSGTDNENK